MKENSKNIIIKGARVNNLKNVDVEIPRGKFVVITGLSGSGKSSLASTPSMPRVSAVMWSHSRHTPASSLDR